MKLRWRHEDQRRFFLKTGESGHNFIVIETNQEKESLLPREGSG